MIINFIPREAEKAIEIVFLKKNSQYNIDQNSFAPLTKFDKEMLILINSHIKNYCYFR